MSSPIFLIQKCVLHARIHDQYFEYVLWKAKDKMKLKVIKKTYLNNLHMYFKI